MGNNKSKINTFQAFPLVNSQGTILCSYCGQSEGDICSTMVYGHDNYPEIVEKYRGYRGGKATNTITETATRMGGRRTKIINNHDYHKNILIKKIQEEEEEDRKKIGKGCERVIWKAVDRQLQQHEEKIYSSSSSIYSSLGICLLEEGGTITSTNHT